MSETRPAGPIGVVELRALLRARLSPVAPPGEPRLAGLSPELSRRYRHLVPENPTPAAVLVPIVDRGAELHVLLTERAPGLRLHAGQISFPGGRLEPLDFGPVEAALRETQEEIGLAPSRVEVLGLLPDHLIISGYRVTPVVGLVTLDAPLALDPSEVARVFEIPLAFVLDTRNLRLRERPIGTDVVEVYDIPYAGRNIWGATAGMLMTLSQLLLAPPDER